MQFNVSDLKLFKEMVCCSNSDDEKFLTKDLHEKQPYFCNIIDPISNDSRCFEAHRYCTLFCAVASEHAESIMNGKYEDYTKIPEQYFDTMARLIIQEKIVIGRRGLSYPDRIQRNILGNMDFDNEDRGWLLMMIPAFLYTVEKFFGIEDSEGFFVSLYHEL